ncbi:MAG: hypothetical protein DRR16_16555 [Candidatus Parabeggiatoa sp. nov. 3]|nr:MAG: hypothetical protein DRR00_21735 [Gammaproteobacteria bacterium]RKZ83732.1 MAG: hypothetical protein DRR16_16555 [Gammaproteobacteria bacterium]
MKHLTSRFKLIFLVILCFSPTIATASTTTNEIKYVWRNLDQTQNQCPELFDAFPEGGMRIFYCHVKTFLSYKRLQRLAPMSVFIKGPHSKTLLNLKSKTEFGYYNKAFVIWLRNQLSSAIKTRRFKKSTQTVYHEYIQSLARTYYIVHELLILDPAYLQDEVEQYLKLIEFNTLPEYYVNRYYEFAYLFDQGFNGDVVKGAVLFWIRRVIDETEAEFFLGLETLLKAYDAHFIDQIHCEHPEFATEAMECAQLNNQIAEQKLKQVYQRLRRKLDKQERRKLQKSQQAWIQFQDHNVEFWGLPYQDEPDEAIEKINIKTKLTQARTQELESFENKWIMGYE